jgi:hypothetical protein
MRGPAKAFGAVCQHQRVAMSFVRRIEGWIGIDSWITRGSSSSAENARRA